MSWILIPYLSFHKDMMQKMTTCIFFRKISNYKHSLNYDYCKRENLWWSMFLTKICPEGACQRDEAFSKQLAQQGRFLFSHDTAHWKSKIPFLWEKSGVALWSEWMLSTDGLQRQARSMSKQSLHSIWLSEHVSVCSLSTAKYSYVNGSLNDLQ